MFDWDDQELSNIIWGETNATDDGIVSYPEEIEKKDLPDCGDSDRKKLNEEDTNSKAALPKTYGINSFSDGAKRESNGGHASSSEVIVDPQFDLPSFSTSKIDNIAIAKKNLLDVAPEISQDQHEDKELGELVGNSWANIGSFDDLDRIFSNDDLDGHTGLGSTDVFWPSSKDIISGASKSSSQALGSTSWEFGALGNTSANFEINSEYLDDENRSSIIPGHQKTDASTSYCERTVGRFAQEEEYDLGTTCLVKEKNLSRGQSKHVQGLELLKDAYHASAVNADSQCTSATVQHYPASVLSQKGLAQDSSSMPYQHLSNPYAVPYGCGSFSRQHLAMHMPKSVNEEYQSVLSNSETCPGDAISLNKPMEASTKPVKMTPQEKIEKLRRRQKMRAMLAIKKQQKQLGHKASSADYIFSQKTTSENQVTHMEKTGFDADDSLNSFPCYEPGSSNKRDDSSTVMDFDDISAEDTVLYQLQDVIEKLDLKIRLCVRDSLYRLAESAMQRSYTSDTSSTNRTSTYRSDVATEERTNHDRFAGKTNMETETNHIDRIVAHLLFHRPLKLSVKHAETPEFSTSTKVSGEKETAGRSNSLVGFPSKGTEIEYNTSPHGSKTCHSLKDTGDEHTLNRKMAEQVD